jgi:hypothetical protein
VDAKLHQSQLLPEDNKFHAGNGSDGKHYWLTPPDVYATLNAQHEFDFDPCPFPKPEGFDGLTAEWGQSSYVNPPFGSILHQGPGDRKPKKKGPTAWARKAIEEQQKGQEGGARVSDRQVGTDAACSRREGVQSRRRAMARDRRWIHWQGNWQAYRVLRARARSPAMNRAKQAGGRRVLVGCECSGRVREALRARGIDAWSCDTQPAEDDSLHHIQGDVLTVLHAGWDGAIFHPECTFLSNSGVQWLFSTEPSMPDVPKGFARWVKMIEAVEFYRALRNAPIPRRVLENPVMHPYAKRLIQPGPRQIVQPWHFGDPFFKATGFELIGVPPLRATHRLTPPASGTDEHKAWSACHREPPGPNRKRNRSRTYPGIAAALADAMVRALQYDVQEQAA